MQNKNDNYYKYFYVGQEDRFWQKHERANNEIEYSDSFKVLIGKMLAVNPENRPSVAEIKESEWYNGDLPTNEELTEEFIIRKAELDEIRNPPAAKHHQNSSGEGGYVYRSVEDDSEETKIDFSKLTVGTYYPEFRRCSRFFIKNTAENLYRQLIDYQIQYARKCEFSEDEYSALIHVKDPESVNIRVNILKVEDEDTHCVEVIKESGDRFLFSEAYLALKKFFISE